MLTVQLRKWWARRNELSRQLQLTVGDTASGRSRSALRQTSQTVGGGRHGGPPAASGQVGNRSSAEAAWGLVDVLKWARFCCSRDDPREPEAAAADILHSGGGSGAASGAAAQAADAPRHGGSQQEVPTATATTAEKPNPGTGKRCGQYIRPRRGRGGAEQAAQRLHRLPCWPHRCRIQPHWCAGWGQRPGLTG